MIIIEEWNSTSNGTALGPLFVLQGFIIALYILPRLFAQAILSQDNMNDKMILRIVDMPFLSPFIVVFLSFTLKFFLSHF